MAYNSASQALGLEFGAPHHCEKSSVGLCTHIAPALGNSGVGGIETGRWLRLSTVSSVFSERICLKG